MQWKPLTCIGFPQYEVSESGEVRHNVTGKIIAQGCYNIKGYKRVNMWSYYKAKVCHYAVHRLVAIVWVPNPLVKTIVNHDDEDIWNNHRLNLRWMTPSENVKYSIGMKRKELQDGCPF